MYLEGICVYVDDTYAYAVCKVGESDALEMYV